MTIVELRPGAARHAAARGRADPLPAALRLVLLGGDWVGIDLPGRLRAQRCPAAASSRSAARPRPRSTPTVCEVAGAVPAGWRSIPYGTPLRNQRCRVVDAQGRDCPDWVAGELWIGGAGVARRLPRRRPSAPPSASSSTTALRWYRTGDLARYRPDGTLEFLGRARPPGQDPRLPDRARRGRGGARRASRRRAPRSRSSTAAARPPRLLRRAVAAEDRPSTSRRCARSSAQRLPAHMVPERVLRARRAAADRQRQGRPPRARARSSPHAAGATRARRAAHAAGGGDRPRLGRGARRRGRRRRATTSSCSAATRCWRP